MMKYLLTTAVLFALFIVVYDLFLKKETFFTINRGYLIGTAILGIVLPFVEIGFLNKWLPSISTPEPLSLSPEMGMLILDMSRTPTVYVETLPTLWTTANIGVMLWGVGVLASLWIFFVKVQKIVLVRRLGTPVEVDGYHCRLIPNSETAFSFLNTIYLGASLTEEKRIYILSHEKAHIRQQHSLDLLFFELLKIVFWFNPFIFIYQKRVVELHEYVADAHAAERIEPEYYCQRLLSQLFQTEKVSFVNTFFNQSLITKRIFMLQKTKSKNSSMLKYALLIPIVVLTLVFTACTSNTHESESVLIEKIYAVKEQMQIQGNISEEEERALRALVFLVGGDDELSKTASADIANDITLPLGTVDTPPIYKGCEGVSETEMMECFKTKVRAYIVSEFDKSVFKTQGITEEREMFTWFRFDNTGKITNIKVREQNLELAAELGRVLKSIPPVVPANLAGVNVAFIWENTVTIKP